MKGSLANVLGSINIRMIRKQIVYLSAVGRKRAEFDRNECHSRISDHRKAAGMSQILDQLIYQVHSPNSSGAEQVNLLNLGQVYQRVDGTQIAHIGALRHRPR